jgi:hypothetical protein
LQPQKLGKESPRLRKQRKKSVMGKGTMRSKASAAEENVIAASFSN